MGEPTPFRRFQVFLGVRLLADGVSRGFPDECVEIIAANHNVDPSELMLVFPADETVSDAVALRRCLGWRDDQTRPAQ